MKLEPGYYPCKYCNDSIGNILDNEYVRIGFCRICGGTKKIDWIENITVNRNINKMKEDKWYIVAAQYDGRIVTHFLNGQIIDKEKSIINVKLKDKPDKFYLQFYLNLDGAINQLTVYNNNLKEVIV